jgi:hypothetical protein
MIGSSLVMLGLVVGLAPAEDTYTIKFKKSAKGDITRIEGQEEGENKIVLTLAGKEVPNQPPQGKEGKAETFVETILERPDQSDRATSLKRRYEKARFTKEGKEQTRGYEGKVVLIEMKGDKYVFQIEGGKEVTGTDAEALDKEFNKKDGPSESEMEKILMPGKPVKVGETWKIDAEKLLKTMAKEGGFGGDNPKASGKLLEVYEKGGHRFGKMDIEMTSPITTFAGGDMVKFKVADGSKLGMKFHLDVCIDGSCADAAVKSEMALDMEATFDAGGMEGKLVMHAKNAGAKKDTEQPKK